MIEPPRITQMPPQLAAVIRLTIPREEIRHVMGPGLGEIMSTLAAQGITPSGPWFSHHLRMTPGIFYFEIGVPVGKHVSPAGRVAPGQLPAATVARPFITGPTKA